MFDKGGGGCEKSQKKKGKASIQEVHSLYTRGMFREKCPLLSPDFSRFSRYYPSPLGSSYSMDVPVITVAKGRRCLCAVKGCNSRFATARGLRRHVSLGHSPQKAFTCEICGKKITRRSHFLEHLKRHDNPKSLVNRRVSGRPSSRTAQSRGPPRQRAPRP